MSAKGSISAVEASAEHEQLPVGNCTRTAQRYKGTQLVANETKIAAIRISTNGWEASVLHGLQVISMHSCRLHHYGVAIAQRGQRKVLRGEALSMPWTGCACSVPGLAMSLSQLAWTHQCDSIRASELCILDRTVRTASFCRLYYLMLSQISYTVCVVSHLRPALLLIV